MSHHMFREARRIDNIVVTQIAKKMSTVNNCHNVMATHGEEVLDSIVTMSWLQDGEEVLD